MEEFLKANSEKIAKVKSSMTYRRLGNAGVRVSELGFGTWVNFSPDAADVQKATDILKLALECGINFIDTAEIYATGNAELILGKALKNLNVKRSDIVISTKLFKIGDGPNDRGLSRKHLVEGLHGSLQRLQLDYVDVLFCHRPDPDVEMEEIVRTMTNFINQGKVFYWATSEWSSQQIQEALMIANQRNLIGPVAEQPEYNLFQRKKVEGEFFALYKQMGLGLTVWSSLAGGLLTGKYLDEIPANSRFASKNFTESRKNLFETAEGKAKLEKVRKLKEVSDSLGISLSNMSLAWVLRNKQVSTILLGASSPQQLLENMDSLFAVEKLDDKVLQQIEEIVQNKPNLVDYGMAPAPWTRPAKKK